MLGFIGSLPDKTERALDLPWKLANVRFAHFDGLASNWWFRPASPNWNQSSLYIA